MHHAELGGREAEAEGVAHQRLHARDLLVQRVVEARHLDRAGPQRGIAKRPDQRQRALAARLRLGIENRMLVGLLSLVLDLLCVHRTAVFVASCHPAATLATALAGPGLRVPRARVS